MLSILTHGRLVLETLEPLPGDRKCFRMINGVLTERTVKEIVPILQTNSDGLRKTLEELVKQYKSKQDAMEKWKVSVHCFPTHVQLYRIDVVSYSRGQQTDFIPLEEEQCTSCSTAPVKEIGYDTCLNSRQERARVMLQTKSNCTAG